LVSTLPEWKRSQGILKGTGKAVFQSALILGKNRNVKPKDAPSAYAAVTERLYNQAAYFAINVSSPNTPGLRVLQDKNPLTDIVQAVNEVILRMGAKKKPLFVKIAPDLTNDALNDIIRVVMDNKLTGIIATNTTIRPDLKGTIRRKVEEPRGRIKRR
jgi:dihydroorotate dehydrogenase